MAQFEARIISGGRVRAIQVTANDLTSARSAVADRGRIVSIRRARSGLFAIRLNRSERYILMIRLAAMTDSKVGIAEALRRVADAFGGRIRRAVLCLLDSIEMGDDLPSAFQRLPQAFPSAIVALLRASCLAGSTSEALRTAAAFEQEISEIERQSSLTLITSLFNFFLAAVVMITTLYYVNPMMINTPLFQSVDQPLEMDGIMLLSTASTLLVTGLAIVLSLLIALATVGRRLAPVMVDRLIAMIPIYRRIALGRDNFVTFYKLSLLIRSGMAIDLALVQAAEGSSPGALHRDLTAAHAAVKAGRSWPDALVMLPPTDRASLAAAEDRVEIVRSLQALALQYKDLYLHNMNTVSLALKMMSLIVLAIAGVILFALTILPMFKVVDFLSRQ